MVDQNQNGSIDINEALAIAKEHDIPEEWMREKF